MTKHIYDDVHVFRSPVSPTTSLTGIAGDLFSEKGETIAIFGHGYAADQGAASVSWGLLFVGTLNDMEASFMPMLASLYSSGDIQFHRGDIETIRDLIKARYESCCSLTVDSLANLGIGAYSWSAEDYKSISEGRGHSECPVTFEDLDGARYGYILMAQESIDDFIAQATTLTQQLHGFVQHRFPQIHPLRSPSIYRRSA